MIVTAIGACSQLLIDPGSTVRWRSLARRGMLHSEVESVDYVSLAPLVWFDVTGCDGVESAWFVVRGQVDVGGCVAPRTLQTGDLMLLPDEQTVRLRGGDTGADLLWLPVLPKSLSAGMPARRPVVV